MNKLIRILKKTFTPGRLCKEEGHKYDPEEKDQKRYFMVNAWKCNELTGTKPFRGVAAEIYETGKRCTVCGQTQWAGEYHYHSGYQSVSMPSGDMRRMEDGELLPR